MNTCFESHTAFPFHLNWNADQLTAAVPLRLHQLFAVDHIGEAAIQASANQPPANQASALHRMRPTSYLPGSALPARFRVR